MLFNSITFVVFFLLIYVLYLFFQKDLDLQNYLLLIASYVFYSWLNWNILFLLLYLTVLNFLTGKLIYKANDKNKGLILGLSIFLSLITLFYFKYFNFFSQNAEHLLNIFGFHIKQVILNIALPIGISFYTFQKIGYTVDVYRNKIKPSSDFIQFALFGSFFPQLVAGPIERSSNLLPQIEKPRVIKLNYIDEGIFLILWGYFKKLVIADNLRFVSDQVFNDFLNYQGVDIILATFAFTIQIYCDFSGYTDIARGVAKLMGFDLMLNFNLPYFVKSPSEFWSKWHISLSTWFRDYLYIPLGGNKESKWKTFRNLMVTMFLGGLWHGARWNYVLWGCYHGLLLIIYRMIGKEKSVSQNSNKSTVINIIQMLLMFILIAFGLLIFRVESIKQLIHMILSIGIAFSSHSQEFLMCLIACSLPLFVIQIIQYKKNDLMFLTKLSNVVRIPVYSILLISIIVFHAGESIEFIYFKF